jgi:hypothetical protein
LYPELRHTRYINRRQAHNFRHAILYAETRAAAQGRQLNTFVTLNFDHTGCPPERVSKAFEKLRDNHFTRWLRYQSLTRRRDWTPAFYVWSIENHGGDTHVHWIVHIPKPLQAAFSEKLPLWLARIAGAVHCSVSAIKVQPVKNLRGLDHYLLKGMDPHYAARYRVRHDPQGLVFGKRCGISKSLGPAARQRGPGDRQAA